MSILRIDCASPSLPWFFLRKAPTSKGRLSVPRIITIQPASAKDGHVRLHYHRRRTGRPDSRNLLGQIYEFYADIRRWSRQNSADSDEPSSPLIPRRTIWRNNKRKKGR